MDNKKNILNSIIIYSSLTLSIIFVYYFIKDYNHQQYDVFFMKGNNIFADFYNPIYYSHNKNPYLFSLNLPPDPERAYPPLAYLISYLFSRFTDFENISALVAWQTPILMIVSILFFSLISLLFFILLYENLNIRKNEKIFVIFILFCSSIFLFSLERGNLVILSSLLTSFYLFNYSNFNKYIKELSFISLALAAGLKIFPAVFGLILIFEKRYKEAFRLIFYGLIVFLIPFLFFEGGLRNINLLIANTVASTIKYGSISFPRFSYRYWLPIVNNIELQIIIKHIMSIIHILVIILSLFISYLTKYKNDRLLILILILVIFPVNSALYNGLYLFVFIINFFNEPKFKKIFVIYVFIIILFLNPFQVIVGTVNLTKILLNISISFLLIAVMVNNIVEIIQERLSSNKNITMKKE